MFIYNFYFPQRLKMAYKSFEPEAVIAVPPDVQEVFDIYWNSNLHGCKWPNITCAVLCIPVCGILIFHNKEDEHAEVQIIDFINHILKPSAPVTVRVYMNYSPCGECSPLLEQLLTRDQVKVSLHIYFVGLYKIKRTSCSGHSASCSNDSSRNGFLKLLKYGKENNQKLQINTFDFGTWNQLVELLKTYFPINAIFRCDNSKYPKDNNDVLV